MEDRCQLEKKTKTGSHAADTAAFIQLPRKHHVAHRLHQTQIQASNSNSTEPDPASQHASNATSKPDSCVRATRTFPAFGRRKPGEPSSASQRSQGNASDTASTRKN